MSLLSLGDLAAARATISAFAGQLRQNGEGMSSMLEAALLYLRQGGTPFTVAGGSAGAGGVERPASPQELAERVVRVDAGWVSPTELHARLSIHPDFHVNAHEPGGGEGVELIPTRIGVEGAAPGVVIEYPPGEEVSFPFASEPVRVYAGDVKFVLRFNAPVSSDVRVNVTYQACDESACLPPVTTRVEVPAP
jgi:hypothetical protein